MAKSAGMTLGVNLALNTQGLAADAQKAVGTISGLGVSINKVGTSTIAAGTAIGTFAANIGTRLVASVKSYVSDLAGLVKKQLDVVDSLAKMGDRFGLTQAEMAGFSLAARLSGSSIESVSSSMQRMQKTIGEAGSGGKTATEALAQLGLTASVFNGKTAAESFGMIADKIKELDSAALRAKATMDIFGKGGMDMAAVILSGSEGIAQATEKTKEYGTAVSEIDVARIEAGNDAWTLAGERVDGLATKIGTGLAPVIYGIADAFLQYVGPNIGEIMDYAAGKMGFFLRVSESLWGVLKMGWAGVKNIIGQPIIFVASLVTELIGLVGRLWERFGGAPDLKDWAKESADTLMKMRNDLAEDFGVAVDEGSLVGKVSKWEQEFLIAATNGKLAIDKIAAAAAKSREELRDMNKAANDLEDAIEPVKEPKVEKAKAEAAVNKMSQAIPQLAGGLVAGSASAANIINRSGERAEAAKTLAVQESMLRKIDQIEVVSRRVISSLDEWFSDQAVVQF